MVKSSSDEYVNLYKSMPMHKIIETEQLPGEVFRKYPKKEIIEVSNLGRIKIENKIIKQWDDDSNGKGWLYIKIGKILDYPRYVYRFVAETWCQCPDDLTGWQVHHITNNGYDNRPENLVWIKGDLHKQIPTLK